MNLKPIGAILLAAALTAAVAMQISGYGLVTTRPSSAAPQVTPGPHGTTMAVVHGPDTLFHLKRIVPVVGGTALGLLCLLPRRDAKRA
jgi:hypothetical protein